MLKYNYTLITYLEKIYMILKYISKFLLDMTMHVHVRGPMHNFTSLGPHNDNWGLRTVVANLRQPLPADVFHGGFPIHRDTEQEDVSLWIGLGSKPIVDFLRYEMDFFFFVL